MKKPRGVSDRYRYRVVVVFLLFALVFVFLAFRMAWIQIVKADAYREKAVNQQTSDIPIEAKRGTIYDSDGKVLATSATCYSVWVRPAEIRKNYKDARISELSKKLAVILNRDIHKLHLDKPEKLRKYIFGYTICNDVSARDLQTRHTQWYLGKSLDGFTPMGPCIITAKEVAYPPKLKLQTYVNGQLRQDSCTDQMIFDINRIVTELSQGMTLKAGTIIITGTPKGVGMGMDPPTFLKKGDVVECRIEEIGSLINTVE